MGVWSFRYSFGYFIFLSYFGLVFMGAPLPKFDERKCDSLSMDECFKDLQVFSKVTDLPLTADSVELDKLCQQCIAGYNCTQTLIENSECLTNKNKETVSLFTSLAQFSFLMLCGDGVSTEKAFMRSKFLEESKCMLKHKNELKCCAKETRVPDVPALQILEESRKSLQERQISVCCPFTRYLQCTTDVAMKCGEMAANFTQEYIRRAAGEPIQGICQNFPSYPEIDTETCGEPVAVCSKSFKLYLSNVLIVLSFFIVLINVSNRIT